MQWITWWPGDYLRDTGDLSLVEHGAYRVLLDHYYSTDGRLRADQAALFRICRAMTDEEQAAVGRVVRLFFTVDAEGWLKNKKADKVMTEAAEFIASKREAGKMGAAKRWHGTPNGCAIGGASGGSPSRGNAAEPANLLSGDEKQNPNEINSANSTPNGTANGTPNGGANGKHYGKTIASTPTTNTKEGGQQTARPDLDFIFTEGLDSLLAGGLNEREARAVLGKMVKDFGEADTAAALQASIGKADVKSYALAILTKKRREAKNEKRFVI